MMDRYCIGKLKPVELVTHIPSETLNVVRNLYNRYLNFSYMITEMQNAITLDHRLQTSVTNIGESVVPRSPYKLQRAIESQDRFFRNYFSELAGPRLEELETLTSQLAGLRKENSIRHMTECLQASDAFQRVFDLPAELFEKMQRLQTEHASDLSVAGLTEVCQFLESHAQSLLADVKAILVQGLHLFEFTKASMPVALGNSIYQTIHLVPSSLKRYCCEITKHLQL